MKINKILFLLVCGNGLYAIHEQQLKQPPVEQFIGIFDQWSATLLEHAQQEREVFSRVYQPIHLILTRLFKEKEKKPSPEEQATLLFLQLTTYCKSLTRQALTEQQKEQLRQKRTAFIELNNNVYLAFSPTTSPDEGTTVQLEHVEAFFKELGILSARIQAEPYKRERRSSRKP